MRKRRRRKTQRIDPDLMPGQRRQHAGGGKLIGKYGQQNRFGHGCSVQAGDVRSKGGRSGTPLAFSAVAPSGGPSTTSPWIVRAANNLEYDPRAARGAGA